MRIIFSVLMFGLMSCSRPSPEPQLIDGFTFSYSVRVVKGTVWGYRANGEILTHHFSPVGLIRDTNTYTLTAEKAEFDTANPDDVKILMSAAGQYCTSIGFLHGAGGIGIMEEGGKLILPDFCVPPNALPSRGAKIGDRVPR